MQTQLRLAGDLGFLDERLVCELIEDGSEVGPLINGVILSMKRQNAITLE